MLPDQVKFALPAGDPPLLYIICVLEPAIGPTAPDQPLKPEYPLVPVPPFDPLVPDHPLIPEYPLAPAPPLVPDIPDHPLIPE